MGTLDSQTISIGDQDDFFADIFTSKDHSPQLFLVPADLQMQSWRYRGIKRAVDIAVAAFCLMLCLIPGLLIAAIIACTSEGPIFYREVRIGRGRKPFRIWKFRSMCARPVPCAKSDSAIRLEFLLRLRTEKDTHDPRITPIGRFLRTWSLDELPQLINILMGDMSLVGPRPVVRAELPLYKHLLDFYLATTPGLSGSWQVSGRSNLSFSARAKLDASYVRTWSLRQDFGILARTVPAVLRRIGAR